MFIISISYLRFPPTILHSDLELLLLMLTVRSRARPCNTHHKQTLVVTALLNLAHNITRHDTPQILSGLIEF